MSDLVDKVKCASGYPCPVPWTELSTTPTGEWRMCCYANPFPDMNVKTHTALEVMTSERMNRIRKAMVDGNVPVYQPWCERCIVLENQGQTSRRQKRWESLSTQGANAIALSNKDNGTLGAVYFEHFDIKFAGNKCNLRCYMCHPFYSSGVALDWKKLEWWNGPRHINPFDDLDETQQERWWESFSEILPYMKVINFTGGEPFMMDDYWYIMDYVMNSGYAGEIELHLSSNLTTLEYKGRQVREYFHKFKRVHLQVSVDAFGPQYNWVRYPASYSVVMDNIDRIREHPKVDLQVTAVISGLTIFGLPSLLEDMDARGLPFRFDNVLTEPKYMRVSSLPMEAKRRLRHVLTDERTFGMLPLLDEPENLEHWEQFKNHLDRLDQVHDPGRTWRWLFPLLGEVE